MKVRYCVSEVSVVPELSWSQDDSCGSLSPRRIEPPKPEMGEDSEMEEGKLHWIAGV